MHDHRFRQVMTWAACSLALLGCTSSIAPKIEAPVAVSFNGPELDLFVLTKMQELNISGVSLAVIENGQITKLAAYGYSNKEARRPVSQNTIFEAASLSKSVFGHFVMTFLESGQLDLDKPLYGYLPHPDLPDSEWHRKITARMVLSHRSGLPNWRENEPGKTLSIKFEPGSQFEYSGEGFQYLAMVLRHLEGTGWNGLNTVFWTRIAAPLSLRQMTFVQTASTRTNRAEPYDETGDRIDWRENYWYQKDDGVFVAASSLHTNAEDFARWMIAVMDGRLINSSSYDQLFALNSDLSTDEQTLHYGLGFAVSETPKGRIIFHSGNNDGFSAWYLMDPERREGYVVLTNSESGVELGEGLREFFE